MEMSPVQPLKTSSEMEVTLLGITIEVILLQSEKHQAL